jgi:hypothetical protein
MMTDSWQTAERVCTQAAAPGSGKRGSGEVHRYRQYNIVVEPVAAVVVAVEQMTSSLTSSVNVPACGLRDSS